MANMSYCRFSNTKQDLEDCLFALRDGGKLSGFEADAGKSMFDDFLDYCQEVGIIEGYDREAVMDLFDELDEDAEGEDEDD